MNDVMDGSVLKLAIVGSGPAGFYTAAALTELQPNSEIDIIERLPTPYGLIRSGVAPDHQSTKSIEEAFELIAQKPSIRFFGNVEVDRDISLNELRSVYDAVILASGSPYDAPLNIPGSNLRGVFGASAFVGWYNAHPDFANLSPHLDASSAVVIGNGNVAIDVARILSKSISSLATSDIATHALEQLEKSALSDVFIVGRRGALDAKFTTVELHELGELDDVVASADENQLPASVSDELPARDRRVKAKNLECFKAFAAADTNAKARRIHFRFNSKPIQILGSDRVEGIRFERTHVENGKVVGRSETYDIPCGLIVSAIGYRARTLGGLKLSDSGDSLVNVDGRIAPGLYVVGWLKRGPSGKIGTNRVDGEAVAGRISTEVSGGGKLGRLALQQHLIRRGAIWTTFEDWKSIEAAERNASRVGAPRGKFASIEKMLSLCSSPACDR